MGIKFDDEVQALLLLLSLPDSWSGTVTAITSSAGSDGFTFEKIRDLILGEDVRIKSYVGVEGIKHSKIFVNRKYIFYFTTTFQIKIQSL